MNKQLTLEDMKQMVAEIEGEKTEEVEDVEYIPVGEGQVSGSNGTDPEAEESVQSTDVVKIGSRDRGEIVYTEDGRGNQTAVERLDDAIAVIDKLRKYYSKIREAAIGVTQTEDWTNWGGKYRLNESGASKIMAQLGIHETTVESRKVNETWGYTIYITRRYVPSWNTSASFDAVGSCRSDDPFVASRRVWDPETKRKIVKQLPAEEVDESNVLKASLANCRVNGVIAVCGLKTVGKHELDRAPYVTTSKIEEVSFKGGKKNQKEWKPTDKQIGFVKKLGGTDADLENVKGYQDLQQLIDGLKAGTHKSSGDTKEEDF